jgi:hypothetical protein
VHEVLLGPDSFSDKQAYPFCGEMKKVAIIWLDFFRKGLLKMH